MNVEKTYLFFFLYSFKEHERLAPCQILCARAISMEPHLQPALLNLFLNECMFSHSCRICIDHLKLSHKKTVEKLPKRYRKLIKRLGTQQCNTMLVSTRGFLHHFQLTFYRLLVSSSEKSTSSFSLR